MANDNYDPYGFSEIEKIQKEIEEDLSVIWNPPPMASIESVGSAASIEETVIDTSINASAETAINASAETAISTPTETSINEETIELTPDPADDIKPFAGEIMLTVGDEPRYESAFECEPTPNASSTPTARDTFYKETIKEVPRNTRHKSLRKLVLITCLICTLGTSTLGLGIGAAIPLTRYYFLGGINAENNGDALNVNTSYDIESTRYVFGDSATAVPRDGALSDVIKLVEPSVVGISPVFESTENNIFGTTQTGEATGIIFSEDSQKVYVATNNHVVSGASLVNVSIADSGPFAAKLVGRDAEADLAVISVEKKDMLEAGVTAISIAVFGDSDAMEVGDVVLAIGNAMGEGNSATSGIISAKEKIIPIQNRNLTVLQTDAAINPGNSGGPLVNTRGEVIGINTAKLSDYYYAVEGMGYSISSNVAKPILEDIMNAGPRPFLGVGGETVTEEIAAQYNIPPIGVIIRSIYTGTGAEKAGIVPDDIITSFNGSAVFSMEQLAEEVRKCQVGDAVEVKILRDGKTPLTLTILLGEYNLDNF